MARNKFGARKTVVDGITFDSMAESRRYQELKLLEAAGEISDLELQPSYELQPKFKRNGKSVAAIVYRADFRYRENGVLVIEDTKGFMTKDFRLKQKLFWYQHPDLELRITA